MPPHHRSRLMTLHEFEDFVDSVIEGLPTWVLDEIDNLVIVVEETPRADQGNILGVYDGFALNERESYSGVMPDRIVIFRQPHLAMGLERDQLEVEIRKTVLHELAHHLGIDDARLTELGWG